MDAGDSATFTFVGDAFSIYGLRDQWSGIARVYVVPNVSATFEMSGFKLPGSINEEYRAHYVDLDLYGTINFNRYVGAQVGWRSLDVGYLVEEDYGNFDVRGMYFGIVARY